MLLKQSLQIQMDVGNESNQGLVLNNIGNTYMNLGNYNDARPYFVQALTIRQRLNVPRTSPTRFTISRKGSRSRTVIKPWINI